MAASFIVSGSTVTIRVEWPGIVTARAQEIVNYAALYDHRRGLGPTIVVDGETVQKPFADLTDPEKLTMCFEAAQRLIVAQAHTGYVDTQQIAARDAAIEYADGEYQLD